MHLSFCGSRAAPAARTCSASLSRAAHMSLPPSFRSCRATTRGTSSRLKFSSTTPSALGSASQTRPPASRRTWTRSPPTSTLRSRRSLRRTPSVATTSSLSPESRTLASMSRASRT
eukprot:Amastigsp_a509634_467.p3 type:complete len:116 gc:universal Amastigsp_a509634_467:1228-881(-)